VNRGEALPSWRYPVADADARAWAEVLRDDNPLHADAAAAGQSGLGAGLVNPGPAGVGYLMTMLLEAFPGAAIRRIQARFLAPVITPTEVVASGTVERREQVAGAELAHVSLELHAGGTLAIAARAVVSLPEARQ
jgi:acyl dehydratase